MKTSFELSLELEHGWLTIDVGKQTINLRLSDMGQQLTTITISREELYAIRGALEYAGRESAHLRGEKDEQ